MYRTKILKLDSSKARKYHNEERTAFEFQLESQISVTNAESIVYSLISAYIPFSFYSLNKNNQWLDVSETIDGVMTTRSISIPEGNYSAVDFSRALMTSLNSSTITYHIVYNRISNTFSINLTKPNTSAMFLFQSGANASRSCHSFLGLPPLDTLINSQPFQTGLITMNDIYYLQIRTDIGSSDNIQTGDGSDGLLDIIPVSDQPLHFISYTPVSPSKFLLQSNTLSSINIALTDNKNRPIDLNGIPYLLTIRIDIVDSEEHRVAVATGREALDSNPEKTNLEWFLENPEKVNPAPPLNLSDLVEYQEIKKMLSGMKKSKRKKI
jgi:hypothetical protein